MMSYLPLMPNAASPLSTWPLPIPLSSHSTQEEMVMTRIQMEREINKAVALRQQHQINGLVKLITAAQMERDDAKQKCLQIQNQIVVLLLLDHQNNLSLSTTETYDASTSLSCTATDISTSMSNLSTALNDAAHQTGEVTGLENAACLLDQPSICRPPFDELVTHNTCLSGNNNPSIDECCDLIINDENNEGLASLLGFEIDEQGRQQQGNMGDEKHEGEMKLCWSITQPCGSITKPCRVLPSYTLEESIEQCNQIPIPAFCCSRDPMACMTTATMTRRGPLPQRGRLVQSVIEAGPLLKDLVLAGSLPNWKSPPPPINCNEIPIPISPSIIPSIHATHPPRKIFTQSFL